MTREEKIAIALEMLSEAPLDTIGQTALIKCAEFGIEWEAGEVSMTTQATISGKRYDLKLVVTWEEVK